MASIITVFFRLKKQVFLEAIGGFSRGIGIIAVASLMNKSHTSRGADNADPSIG